MNNIDKQVLKLELYKEKEKFYFERIKFCNYNTDHVQKYCKNLQKLLTLKTAREKLLREGLILAH